MTPQGGPCMQLVVCLLGILILSLHDYTLSIAPQRATETIMEYLSRAVCQLFQTMTPLMNTAPNTWAPVSEGVYLPEMVQRLMKAGGWSQLSTYVLGWSHFPTIQATSSHYQTVSPICLSRQLHMHLQTTSGLGKTVELLCHFFNFFYQPFSLKG